MVATGGGSAASKKAKLLDPMSTAEGKNWRCKVCGQPLTNGEPLDKHHLTPVHQGGSHKLRNLVTEMRQAVPGRKPPMISSRRLFPDDSIALRPAMGVLWLRAGTHGQLHRRTLEQLGGLSSWLLSLVRSTRRSRR
jgi:hypothetical protein